MFSPLENEELDHWFQRLNAPLKHLPAQERVQLHAEVRQHLEALVAANEELGSTPEEAWQFALTQFGDPTRIGRRLGREAMALPSDPNRWAMDPLTAAFTFAFVQCAGLLTASLVLMVLATWSLLLAEPSQMGTDLLSHGVGDVFGGMMLTAPIWSGWITGCRMNRMAVKGTFCGLIPWAAMGWAISIFSHDILLALALAGSFSGGCAAAWFAQRCKRTLGVKKALPPRTGQNYR